MKHNHVLTGEQARRLNTPKLAGKTVQVELYKPSELSADQSRRGVRMAKTVWFNGVKIGGLLHLDE